LRLEGRIAVITGGGRGIGAAIARALAGAGAAVLVAARTTAEVEGVAAAIAGGSGDGVGSGGGADGGGRAFAAQCDVTDPVSVASLARVAAERLGAVDILVNNAGVSSSAPLHRLTLDEWNRLFAVNATGTFLCTQAFVPGMVERGWGRVINIASVAGLAGARYIAAYTAAKHAVIGFTRSVAAELAATGVTINAICPGYVDTPMTDASIARIVEKTGRPEAEARAAILETSPQHRLIQPEEVAQMALSLCHEQARGINGQAIVIDGGGILA
jgi:NAD(P)-dependent dehydrogenase (short-subunit alcohol dehydrogenase family)